MIRRYAKNPRNTSPRGVTTNIALPVSAPASMGNFVLILSWSFASCRRSSGRRAMRCTAASDRSQKRHRPSYTTSRLASRSARFIPSALQRLTREMWLRCVTRRPRRRSRAGSVCIRRAEKPGMRDAASASGWCAALLSRALQFSLERGKRTCVEDVSGLEARAPRQVHGVSHEREIAGLVAVGRKHESHAVLLRRRGECVRKVHPLGVAVDLEQTPRARAGPAELLEIAGGGDACAPASPACRARRSYTPEARPGPPPPRPPPRPPGGPRGGG